MLLIRTSTKKGWAAKIDFNFTPNLHNAMKRDFSFSSLTFYFKSISSILLSTLVGVFDLNSKVRKAIYHTFLIFVLIAFVSFSYPAAAQHTLSGSADFLFPAVSQSDETIVKHHFYNVSYNCTTKQPNYVSYTLKKSMLTGTAKRSDHFTPDPIISSQCSAENKHYYSSGFDRGHLAPAMDFVFSQTAMNESFYLSNISPQNPHLNRNAWRNLESKIRKWAGNFDSLIIVSGPIFVGELSFISESGPAIPQMFFKVVFAFQNGSVFSAAFIYPNFPAKYPTSYYSQNIDMVEEATKFDFLHKWNSSKQNEIESRSDFLYIDSVSRKQ